MKIVYFVILITHMYFSVRYLYSGLIVFKFGNEDAAVEDYSGRNLLAPIILVSSIALFFVIGIVDLFQINSQQYTDTLAIVGIGLLPIPAYLNSKRFIIGVEKTIANRNQYKAIMTVVIVFSIVASSYLIWSSQQLDDAPFIYDPDSVIVQESYCLGDPLFLTFDGLFDGSGRIIKVEGELKRTDDDDRDYTISEYSFTNDNMAISDPIEFNDFIFNSFVIPRNVPIGTYEWHHKDFAIDIEENRISNISSFVSPQFDIVNCGE